MGGLRKKVIEKEREKLKTGGRALIPIDWEKVDTLLLSGCNGVEIAAHFAMHPDTFSRRLEDHYGIGFTAYCYEKRKQGDSLIKHTQFMKALGKSDKGDNTLLIWLGKNRLEQRDTPKEDIISPESVQQFNALMKQFQDLQSDRNIDETNNNDESKS